LTWKDAEFDENALEEDLPETPDDVIRILGYDPLEED
jgi:hypothetical protein